MEFARSVFYWFSGGVGHQYHTLQQCMHGQTGWVTATVVLDLAVFVGYLIIAGHWARNERTLPPSPARRALADVRHIFVFCGICGYLFNPVKLVWPAWRLYDGFMLVLVFFTYRYAFNVKGLKVLYSAVGRGNQLEDELSAARMAGQRQDRFVEAVGRDLRTPMDRLLGHVDQAAVHLSQLRLTAAGASPAVTALDQSLAQARASAQITAGLLNRLVEYARMDDAGAAVPLSVTGFPLAEAAAGAVTSHRRAAAAKGVDLSAVVPPGLSVRTDRGQLERVLDHLVGHAVRATTAGSVRLTAESAATGVEVHVTDTGPGLTAEQLPHVFDPLSVPAADDDRAEQSMVLAVTRRTARRLGGDLTVTSTPGRGSRFTLILPETVVFAPAASPADSESATLTTAPQPALTR